MRRHPDGPEEVLRVLGYLTQPSVRSSRPPLHPAARVPGRLIRKHDKASIHPRVTRRARALGLILSLGPAWTTTRFAVAIPRVLSKIANRRPGEVGGNAPVGGRLDPTFHNPPGR